MLIYLGAFAVSVGIAAYGEHLRTKKNNEKEIGRASCRERV